jgi:hypothetical protein
MPKADKPAVQVIAVSPTIQRLSDKLLKALGGEDTLDAIHALMVALTRGVRIRSKQQGQQPSELAREVATWFVETVDMNEDMRRKRRH